MLHGKQYARAIRGIRMAHEALSQMFLTSPKAFAIKNSLPWLTNETKYEIWSSPSDHKMQLPVPPFAEDAIPLSVLDTITLFQKEGRQHSETFAFWDIFLESGNILLRRADREVNVLMHIQAHFSCSGNCPLFRPCWAN